MTSPPAPLVLAAHGSADPRFGAVMDDLANLLRLARPALNVVVGYLEHGPPALPDVLSPGCVVVPILLSRGFHVRHDIPGQVGPATVADSVGPDPRLAGVLADRLRAAGWDGQADVTLAAAGSSDPDALADVRSAAADLAALLGRPVRAAFVSDGEPRLADLRPRVVASYLLAPGRFSERLTGCGAEVVGAPIGADPVLAAVILDRYDAARRVAPTAGAGRKEP